MNDQKHSTKHIPWNRGKLIGQKRPLKPHEVWAIRIHLQMKNRIRDLALFNLAIDSKLRGCDLLSLTLQDIARGNNILSRAKIIQQKTQRPVQFEITEHTQASVRRLIEIDNIGLPRLY